MVLKIGRENFLPDLSARSSDQNNIHEFISTVSSDYKSKSKFFYAMNIMPGFIKRNVTCSKTPTTAKYFSTLDLAVAKASSEPNKLHSGP